MQKLIEKHAKSHSGLKRLLNQSQQKSTVKKASLSKDEKLKQFYESAQILMGSSVDTLFCGHILTKNSLDNKYLHEIAMISKFGVRQENKVQSCLFHTRPKGSDCESLEPITSLSKAGNSQFSVGVSQEHSTPGLIDSYANFSASNLGFVFNPIPNVDAIDATFLVSNPDELLNPMVDVSKSSSTYISIKMPTKKLVMAVFLDRKIDMCSSVSVGCFNSRQQVDDKARRASDLWSHHLPDIPELRIVDFELQKLTSSEYCKTTELTDYMFNFAQLDRKDFVCYLIDVDYPIWSSTYRMYFEHS